MNARYIAWAVGVAALIALPFVYRDPYHLHILVLILIWSFAYTSWSMMGRFGLVSLGHGGFMGVGAYVTALLWNHLGVSPWIGIPDRAWWRPACWRWSSPIPAFASASPGIISCW